MRELRLPLQVGTSSLAGFSRASAALVPGFLLMGSIGLPILFAPWDEAVEILPALAGPYVFALIFAVGMIGYALKHFSLAMRERPSDIVLGQDGIRIVGGPLSGLAAPWSEIEGAHILARHEKLELVETKDDKTDNIWRLIVALRDGSEKVFGTSEDPRERDSLKSLADSIEASVKKAAPATQQPAKPKEPTALHCRNCGAPAVPTDLPSVPCAFCGEAIVMPDDVRVRIRAVIHRDTSTLEAEKLVAQLVHQPGARRIGFLVFLATVPSFLAWPAAVCALIALYMLCYLRAWDMVALPIAALALIAALYYLVRGQLTDRQALRLITLAFAARAPATAGGAHHCRHCNAPLVEPPGAVVVRCVHCSVENVLGLDARSDAREGQSQVQTLEESLFRRKMERNQWRFSALVALGLLGLSTILVAASLRAPHELLTKGNARLLERVTYDPFDEFQPKVSPNGAQLLFDLRVPHSEGNEAIMLSDATGAFRGTEMTHEKMHAIRPVWLHDGSGFLYVAQGAKDTLRKVTTLAPFANATDLYSFGHDIDVPSVSPDNLHVVFSGADKKAVGWNIYVGSLDGKPDVYVGPGINPAWSPDGTHIAYSRTLDGRRHILVMNADGTKPIQITKDDCDHEDPVYAPDGTYLAYVSNCGGHSRDNKNIWDLWVMKPDGSAVEQLTAGQADVETPTWSGDYVYFSADVAGNYDVWRVSLTGPLAGHGGAPKAITPMAPPVPTPTVSATSTSKRRR